LQPGHRESAIAVAEAAIAAKDWDAAREAMKPLLAAGPTQRVCLIMADIEEGQHGDRGRMRDWLGRAVRAPRDAVWTADGYVSERWLPVSPLNGEIDAFEWKVPVAQLGAPLEMDDLNDLAGPLPEPEPETQPEPEPVVEAAPIAEVVSEPVEAEGEAAAAEKIAAPLPRGQDMPHAPDDPGIEPEAVNEKKSFRLF
jgi:HemY protein